MISFYFDVISPYAYLAWRRLPALAARRGETLSLRPLLFAGLLDAWGQKGPAEIVPKRAHAFRDVLRQAKRHGFALNLPATHPFNPLLALRVAQAVVAGDEQARVVDALFRAGWERGEELGSADVIRAALDREGLDGAALVAKAGGDEAKAALRATGAEALSRGVFGVPTMVVEAGGGREAELFWGHDQLETLDAFLGGDDALDRGALAGMIGRGASADRLKGKAGSSGHAPTVAATPTATLTSATLTSTPTTAAPSNDEVARIFYKAPFVADTLGIKLAGHGEGWCEATVALDRRHLQQDGYVHAGVQATIADHTAGAAAGSVVKAGQMVLSIEFKINLLRPAVGEALRCRADVLRAGRMITIVESSVFARKGAAETLVSKATVTLAVVEAR